MVKQRDKKLLLLTTTCDIGGMPRITTGLAREFMRRGWQVRYAFPNRLPNNDALSWYREQGITPEIEAVTPKFWLRRHLSDLLALRRFIADYRPDVVNLHYGDNSISLKDMLFARLAGKHRLVVSVHHPTPLHGKLRHKRRMTALAAHLADAIVVFSRATRDSLLEDGTPARKIRIIPCGLPIPTDLPSRDRARAVLGLPSDTFVVASLARLVPEKGIADLIEAVSRIPDPQRQLRLMIAGTGPERGALEEQGSRLLGRRVRFLGHIASTADLYAAADIFALPSHMEGFGLVYIEAAFYGIPSIGVDAGGVPDAIADGETGLLIPSGDVGALTTAIERCRDEAIVRRRLGDNARTRALADFTEVRMADRFAQVFRAR